MKAVKTCYELRVRWRGERNVECASGKSDWSHCSIPDRKLKVVFGRYAHTDTIHTHFWSLDWERVSLCVCEMESDWVCMCVWETDRWIGWRTQALLTWSKTMRGQWDKWTRAANASSSSYPPLPKGFPALLSVEPGHCITFRPILFCACPVQSKSDVLLTWLSSTFKPFVEGDKIDTCYCSTFYKQAGFFSLFPPFFFSWALFLPASECLLATAQRITVRMAVWEITNQTIFSTQSSLAAFINPRSLASELKIYFAPRCPLLLLSGLEV